MMQALEELKGAGCNALVVYPVSYTHLDVYKRQADTDAPATEAPATTGDSTKPNTNSGVEGVAAVAGVALLAAGAVVVAKKRK